MHNQNNQPGKILILLNVRIAECNISDTLKVGFLSDTTGMLEDALVMTNAGFQPITDRTLLVGDLNSYNVIVIGSGAFKNFASV